MLQLDFVWFLVELENIGLEINFINKINLNLRILKHLHVLIVLMVVMFVKMQQYVQVAKLDIL